MEEACIGNDYNLWSKGGRKMNDSPSTSKINNNNSTSKQSPVDKSPEKGECKREREGKRSYS
jgi:hypothetical protein